MRVFSYGGGVQSTAALVLATQGVLQVDAFLFANVGDDSEHPATLRYVHEVAMPYATQHGIVLHELHRTRRDSTAETLYGDRLTGKRPRGGIPMRMPSGAPARRECTHDFKVAVINRWLREHGATVRQPALVMLGISTDEELRARHEHDGPRYRQVIYPLLERGRRMSRLDCIAVIARAGLPVPPKSACWFCPWHSVQAWRALRASEPTLFARAAEMETNINRARAARGLRPMWLTDALKPLPQAVQGEQPSLFPEAENACESGFCMV